MPGQPNEVSVSCWSHGRSWLWYRRPLMVIGSSGATGNISTSVVQIRVVTFLRTVQRGGLEPGAEGIMATVVVAINRCDEGQLTVVYIDMESIELNWIRSEVYLVRFIVQHHFLQTAGYGLTYCTPSFFVCEFLAFSASCTLSAGHLNEIVPCTSCHQ